LIEAIIPTKHKHPEPDSHRCSLALQSTHSSNCQRHTVT
jgi:hypothetical protein